MAKTVLDIQKEENIPPVIITSTIKIPSKAWTDFDIIIQRKNAALSKKDRKKKRLNKSLVISQMIQDYNQQNVNLLSSE